MSDRELIQLMYEALDYTRSHHKLHSNKVCDALNAADARLAEPEQSYGAWVKEAEQLVRELAAQAYIDGSLHNMRPWSECSDYTGLLAHLRNHPAAPEGYVLVPVEPTQEMLNAGYEAGKDSAWSYKNCYAAMIAAAQKESGK